MPNLEFISPPPACPYDENEILAACQGEQVTAGHGEAYSGRPVTSLIHDADRIIKLRTEYQLPEDQARRFVAQAIEREKSLGVYHPHKTWFLWGTSDEDESQVVIGNVTPYLLALNQNDHLWNRYTNDEILTYIHKMIDLYLVISAKHELSLDLCLSNFGIDDQQELYYLDDDVYPSSNLDILSAALGTLLRSQDWLSENHAQRLGEAVRVSLLQHFDDWHWITVVAEGLRGVYLSPQRQPVAKALIDALQGEQTFSFTAAKPNDGTIIGLMADIHGNAPALECALEYFSSRGIDTGLVLGDVVGYGPQPQQCIDMLRDLAGWDVIRGNHDHAVASGQVHNGISSMAGWTLNWTLQQLCEQAREWLAQLPPYMQGDQWLAVHGSPKDKTFFNAYVYQMSYVENLDELALRGIPLCFHGHTHIQKTYQRTRAGDSAHEDAHQSLSDTSHALICPGSVGQARGGMLGVELAILDLATLELEFHRLPYDVDLTIKEMHKQNFPSDLADRLLRGQ